MPSFPVHPTTRFGLWLSLMLLVQLLSGRLLLLAFVLMPFLGVQVLRRGSRLIWRARWLLLSLFLILAWGTAGDPVWNGAASPTLDGLAAAWTQLGRLLLVLVAVAAFLEFMPLADLLTATHFMLRPLRRFGFDPDRGVVRLMLVLRYVETLPRPRDWRSLLNVPTSNACELVEVRHRPLQAQDYALAFACVAALVFVASI